MEKSKPEINLDNVTISIEDHKKEQTPKARSNHKPKEPDIPYYQCFQCASPFEKCLVVVGCLLAICASAVAPLQFYVIGGMVSSFVKFGTNSSSASTTASITSSIYTFAIYFSLIGLGSLLFHFLKTVCIVVSAERQTKKIRLYLYYAILHQNIGWFDTQQSGALVSILTDEVDKIENGIGERLVQFIYFMGNFVGILILNLITGWKLGLVALATAPVFIVSFAGFAFVMRTFTRKEFAAYRRSGAIAEEVLTSVKTIFAFSAQKKECENYSKNLIDAQKMTFRKSVAVGCCVAFIPMCVMAVSALITYYGSRLIISENYDAGLVIQVFISGIYSSVSVSNALPALQVFSEAKVAAAKVFSIINRKPEIDSRKRGKVLPRLRGDISLRNISFKYPNRDDVQILNNFSLDIPAGKTVAIVGSSGCGKSTIIQLLQRFYDPVEGEVFIDGEPLKELDLSWYRQKISVVQQEPPLFQGTIADNIRLGRLDATMEDVVTASIQANAHNFITQLPKGYETWLGEGGGLLSGGQKQRIAIARALLNNPSILLLDEATSALDNQSERIVQEALDKVTAQSQVTVIVIAHRLSTVRNSDSIVVMNQGRIIESGSHDDLIAQEGQYYQMCTQQQLRQVESKDTTDEFMENIVLEDMTEELDEVAHMSVKRRRYSRRASINYLGKVRNFALMMRLIKLNAPEKWFAIGGCFCAGLYGMSQPAYSLLFSSIIESFLFISDVNEFFNRINLFSGLLALIGLTVGICTMIRNIVFGVANSRLTRRLRESLFEAILKQEVGWFDRAENQPGTLIGRLAMDATYCQGASTVQLGLFAEASIAVIAAIAIAFYYSWQLAILTLAFMPVLAGLGVLQVRTVSGKTVTSVKHLLKSANVTLETLNNIRTVVSLARENYFHQKFVESLFGLEKKTVKKSLLYGLFIGMSDAVIPFAYSTVFALGAYLVEQNQLQFPSIFRVFSAIIFCSQAVGRAIAFAPDLGKAVLAAQRIFNILDRKPLIDSSDSYGEKPTQPLSGRIVFRDVNFSYPTRHDIQVLKGINLSVNRGQTVALVGESGCGKSTLTQLVERFYDLDSGSIDMDEHPIASLNVRWLRNYIGIVSQEPVLFNRSIRENILYGVDEHSITQEEIAAAATEANIEDFIESLPQKYETIVGPRGSQLSGGQKQRIAIARALIRNPIYLLLDEATSALDGESEAVVQNALDKARNGRTCLVIAHRLATIQNADKILVFEKGCIAESGTHDELMRLGKIYHSLATEQHNS